MKPVMKEHHTCPRDRPYSGSTHTSSLYNINSLQPVAYTTGPALNVGDIDKETWVERLLTSLLAGKKIICTHVEL